jgi:hypothetical protein
MQFDLAQKIIDYSMKQRLESEGEGEGDKEVVIDDQIYMDLCNSNYFSKKKGKALFMLASNRKFEKINRKRKKEYGTLDLTKELKLRKDKRIKTMEEEKDSKQLGIDTFIEVKNTSKHKMTKSKEDDDEDDMNVDSKGLMISANRFNKKS